MEESVALVIFISASDSSSFRIKSGSNAGVKTLYFNVCDFFSIVPNGLEAVGARVFTAFELSASGCAFGIAIKKSSAFSTVLNSLLFNFSRKFEYEIS